MASKNFDDIVSNITKNPNVTGIFITGSGASELKPESDIDLVIILKKNPSQIKSVYTTIRGRFADIFFFDEAFVKKLQLQKMLAANDFEGMFCTWLEQGAIYYDQNKTLARLKKLIQKKKLTIKEEEKRKLHLQVNYNYIANKRYYVSKNPLYRDALLIRLAYSIPQLCTAYCSFRNIPWRGEKKFVAHLVTHDKKYLSYLKKSFRFNSLTTAFRAYETLFKLTVTHAYPQWRKGFLIQESKTPVPAKQLQKLFK